MYGFWLRAWLDAEQVEHVRLERRGAGVQVELLGGAFDAHAAAGQRGQIAEQRPQAVDRQAVVRPLGALL